MTPVALALSAQRGFRSFGVFSHGFLAGLAFWQLIMVRSQKGTIEGCVIAQHYPGIRPFRLRGDRRIPRLARLHRALLAAGASPPVRLLPPHRRLHHLRPRSVGVAWIHTSFSRIHATYCLLTDTARM